MNQPLITSIGDATRSLILTLALSSPLASAGCIADSPSTTGTSWRPPVMASASTAASDDEHIRTQRIEQARTELDVALRLLEALDKFETPPWSRDYIHRLEAVVEQARANLDGPGERLAQLLITPLQTARQALLAEVPSARLWTRLARIITPDKRLAIPRRLLGKAKSVDNDLDIDAIKTGAWIRAWDIG